MFILDIAIDNVCYVKTDIFSSTPNSNEYEHNGGVGYATNYALSTIRLWLNLE